MALSHIVEGRPHVFQIVLSGCHEVVLIELGIYQHLRVFLQMQI